MTKKELREFVRKTIVKISDVNESDLITKDTSIWEKMKKDFKENVFTLIQNIENDEYENAKDVIGNTMATLQFWRGKIKRGLEKGDGEKYNLNRFGLGNGPSVLDEKDEED